MGIAPQLRKLTGVLNEVNAVGSLLPVSRQVISPGVTFNSHLRFDTHVNNVVRACNYHSRALRHIRNMLTSDVAKALAYSIVSSRLGYCKSLLCGAWSTNRFHRHIAACSEHSYTHRPTGRQSLKCKTFPTVAPLAAGAGEGSLQNGTAGLQSSKEWPASISTITASSAYSSMVTVEI
jgi:hypothetical protein